MARGLTRSTLLKYLKRTAVVAVPFAALAYASPVSAATAPSLGAAASFAVLASSTVTCTGASAITGDIGVWPGSAIVLGATPCTLTGTLHAGDGVAKNAHDNAVTAYNGLAGATCNTDLTGQDLGALANPLPPGVYCFATSAQLTGTLNLTGGGVYIFKIGSTLTTASASSVLISNAQPCDASSNVFWQVGSSATLGTTTAFAGNILAFASITMTTGATMNGRAIALNGAVTMDTNMVSGCRTATGGGGGGDEDKDKDKDRDHDKDHDKDRDKDHCNQGVGNGREGCDPGDSDHRHGSNDENGGTPGDPGRKGGND